ncbi:MAG: hypothetical protein HC808_19535 [Candidatus Competibacteraceae bacterium]|nr:hypothetical protein [Candidatus Competibacteraceae bacterium]
MLAGDRNVLAQTITLVESNASAHFDTAQEVLRQLLPHTGKSIRVGITGVPGVGKSTFIEALGLQLCEQGHRVAVLAVDPSSTVTRGSILGDKTRMDQLSQDLRAFIRPSPSSTTAARSAPRAVRARSPSQRKSRSPGAATAAPIHTLRFIEGLSRWAPPRAPGERASATRAALRTRRRSGRRDRTRHPGPRRVEKCRYGTARSPGSRPDRGLGR